MTSLLVKNIHDASLSALLNDGNVGALRDELRWRLANSAPSAQLLTMLALVELELNALDEAAGYASQAMELAPDDASTIVALGTVLLKQRHFDKVIALGEAATKAGTANAEIFNLTGRAYNNAGQLLKARAAFEQALSRDLGFAEAQHNIAHVFRRMGDLSSAAEHFLAALAIQPDYFSAASNLGTVRLAQENFPEAETSFRKALLLAPTNAMIMAHLGLTLFKQEQFEEAEGLLRKSIELAPNAIEAPATLAMLLKERGQTDASIEMFKSVYDPGRPDVFLAARYAAVLVESGKDAQASELASQLLARLKPPHRPEQHDDYLSLAQVMRAAGRVDLAINFYQIAVALKPSGAREHMLLAGAQVQAEQPEAALRTLEKSLQLRPGYQSALALKITALRRAGRMDEARGLQDLERFIYIADVSAPENYADTAAFNTTLSAAVMAEPSLEFERAGHATRKGRHTGTLDIESPGPFRDLAQLMSQQCRDFMSALPVQQTHPFLSKRPRKWRLQMWSVVMDSQGYQVPHTHDDGYLSGVYYPLLPGNVAEAGEQQAGWIEFGRPMKELIGNSQPEIRRIAPREGRLVIFPSYFVHSTVPFESSEPRISIAFDLIPLEWEGDADVPQVVAGEDAKLEFLERFSASEIEHSEHDLLQHLTGVRDVIASWDERPALTDAALFHSVYGTESFTASAIPVNLRARVQRMIGTEAEHIAWLFGAMRKGSFYANLDAPDGLLRVQSRHDGQWLDISAQDLTDLVRVTVANWFEQLPRVSAEQREQMRALFMKMRGFLNDKARTQFDGIYPASPSA